MIGGNKKKLPTKAVLEGGGAKGNIYIGVADSLEKLGVLKDIDSVAGASVGAIGALVLSTGWSVEKMKGLFSNLDISKLATGGWRDYLKIPYTVLRYFGLFRADEFHTLFQNIVEEVTGNKNCTFEEWHNIKEANPDKNMKDIFAVACNLNTKLNETFSHLDEKNKKVPIADAIRASMSFPGYFTPWIINGCKYSDGGIQNNCPSNVFEKEPGVFNSEVFTVRLDSLDEINYYENGVIPPPTEINTAMECAIAQAEAMLDTQNADFHQSQYKTRTAFCDTMGVPTLKFNLTDEEKAGLYASGQYGVIRYFLREYPELTAQKIDPKTLQSIKTAGSPISFTEFMSKQPKSVTESLEAVTAKLEPAQATNVVSIGAKSKGATPLFHHWCKLPALHREHARRIEVESKAKLAEEKPKKKITA